MNFEELIENFTDNHPVWTWILARFLIVLCGCGICVVAFVTLLAMVAPFMRLEEVGLAAFAAWFWLPVTITIIWALGSAIGKLYENYIESW